MKRWHDSWSLPAWSALLVIVACIGLNWGADWLPLATPYKRHLAAATLQFVFLTLACGVLTGWWVGRTNRPIGAVSPRAMWIAVLAGITVYAGGLSYLSVFRHQALLTGIYDLGYYAQLTWELSKLQIPRSSVWYDSVWGNHATFILAVVAPFLWLLPNPATLLVIQSLVLALGAVPAYCLGRRVWDHPVAGAVSAGAYLLYPPLQFANLFDFHADTFATPILLAAFASIFAGRTRWALAWAGLLMLVKEDMALVALTFGLYVAAVHRRPSGLGLAATAAVAFVLLIVVVIPSWTQSPYFSVFNRWRHLGNTPWELIASPVLRPGVFFSTVLQPERLGYLVLLVIPLAGLPLLAPEVMAVGLPPLVSNLLSSSEMQYTIRGHYTAALTPILIAAAVVGSRRAAVWIEGLGCRPRAVLAAMATTSVIASVTFSPLPWSQDPFARKQFWDVNPRIALATFTSQIPPDATVSAANHLGAHFSFRKEIDIYPSGFDTADFVLVDLSGLDYVGRAPKPEAFRPLLRRLVEARPLVAFEDDLALFGQGVPSQATVAKLINLRPTPASNARPVGEFMLIGVSLAPSRLAPREYLRARYTWAARRAGHGVPCIAESLVPPGGVPVWEGTRPLFHALLSGEQWQTGWAANDATVTVLPETVLPGRYAWGVLTWDDTEGTGCRNKPHDMTGSAVGEVTVLPW